MNPEDKQYIDVPIHVGDAIMTELCNIAIETKRPLSSIVRVALRNYIASRYQEVE